MENNTSVALTGTDKIVALFTVEQSNIQAVLGLHAPAGANLKALAMQELDFLQMHMAVKPFIADCEAITVIQAVKYTLKNNLSLDPNAGLVYLMPSSAKVGNAWKTILEIKPTAEGRISIAKQAGTLIYNKRPQVVKDANGKVVKAFVEMLFPCGNTSVWETIEIDESDFKRFRTASHTKNSRGKNDAATVDYSNKLYTSFYGGIDPEFARSKVISVALKKRGTNLSARINDNVIIAPMPLEKQPVSTPPTIEKSVYEEVATNTSPVTSPVKTEDAVVVVVVVEEAVVTETVNAVVIEGPTLFPATEDL